jgi:hypothetical protein
MVEFARNQALFVVFLFHKHFYVTFCNLDHQHILDHMMKVAKHYFMKGLISLDLHLQ